MFSGRQTRDTFFRYFEQLKIMLANIQDLTSVKNHLLNNEINEAKSLLARKQAAFKDVTRAAKVTLETLPREDRGTSLIPEDVTVKQGE